MFLERVADPHKWDMSVSPVNPSPEVNRTRGLPRDGHLFFLQRSMSSPFPLHWAEQQQKNLDKNPFLAEACLMEVEEVTDNAQVKHTMDHVVISAEEDNENQKEDENRA